MKRVQAIGSLSAVLMLGVLLVACSGGESAEVSVGESGSVVDGPGGLRVATRAVREPQRQAIEDRLEAAERLYLDELLQLHDGVEGIRAFLEKREPEWKNA